MPKMDSETTPWMFTSHKGPSKDSITGHKLALLVLVREYCRVKTGQHRGQGEEAWSHTNKQCRDFAITTLNLLQSPDMSLSQLAERVKEILHPQTYELFVGALKTLYEGGVAGVMDYIPQLDTLLADPNMTTAVLHKSSVLGLFVRRMLLALDKLNFNSLMKLHCKYQEYYRENFGDEAVRRNADTRVMASQRQADYFLAQQVALMHLNEKQALPPPELQRKIRELLAGNPDITEAQYVSFLNCLNVKEYCNAVESLHHHFDRNIQTHEGTSKNNQEESTKNLRFAALNLAMLHFKFGHRREALTLLREAVTLAQEANDNCFLQHALTWLSRLQEFDYPDSNIRGAVTKSSELGLWQIASLEMQSLCQTGAENGAMPAAVFELLSRSDQLNMEHSMLEPTGMALVSRAALWNLYGFNRMSVLLSQLLLHLTWIDPLCAGGVQPIGEATCLALRNLATAFALRGDHRKASEVIKFACSLFPPYSDLHAVQQLCELECRFEEALYGCDWPTAEHLVCGIHVLDSLEGRYCKARLSLWQEHFQEALSITDELLEDLAERRPEGFKGSPAHFLGRVFLLKADIYVEASQPVAAIPVLSQGMVHAKQHHLAYLQAALILRTADVQFRVGLPEQAQVLLEGVVTLILAQGGQNDVGKLCLLLAKCGFASEGQRDLQASARLASRALECFKSVRSNRGVREGAYWLALISDAAGLEEQRNDAAQTFRKADREMAEKLLYVV
ncbi:anaphase-promoting complex subunit 5-like [Ornithodoros turicata]|uniref:anaphase-promoting complex subunit 5-like n=1 Tax=Ornithodoros turicata TaxID=34597 RepID=UPI0031398EC9